MRTTNLIAHLTQFTHFAATRHRVRAVSATACLIVLGGAAHAQTQGPATSFNVLSFGGPTANKRTAVSANGEIPPLDYSLVSALTTNVTQSLLGSGEIDAHANASVVESGKGVFGYGMGGSLTDGLRRNVVVRERLADLRAIGQGAGGRSGAGSGSTANGAAQVGFDTLDLTGRSAHRNIYTVNASDFTRASRLAFHNPAGSVAVVNVVGAQRTPDAFPIVTGMSPNDVYFNFVSADNTSAGNTASSSNSNSSASNSSATGAGNAAGGNGKDSGGYLNTGLSAANLSTGNAGDPVGAFDSANGGSGDYAQNGAGGGGQMGQSGQPGSGGINAATPPPAGVSSVLPENSSLLLLCSGLLGLLPLAWRRR